MFRRILCIICAVGMLLVVGIRATASTGDGTIRISLRSGNQKVSDGEITLFLVGELTSAGYRLTEQFGGGIISVEDAQTTALAKWLTDMAEEGTVCKVDKNGEVEFTNLQEGLYLLVQTQSSEGYYPISPFLIRLPWMEEHWYIEENPKMEQIPLETPRTGEQMAPIISAMGMLFSGTGLLMCWEWKRRG